jgi:hypothetical protein
MKQTLFRTGLVAFFLTTVFLPTQLSGATYRTQIRINCDVGWSVAFTSVTLYREGVLLAGSPIECTDGASETIELITSEKPDAWDISQGGGTDGSVAALLIGDSGDSFPDQYQRGVGHKVVQIWIGRPRVE